MKDFLDEMKELGLLVHTPWIFELTDVVVPTAEQWTAVRQGNGQR